MTAPTTINSSNTLVPEAAPGTSGAPAGVVVTCCAPAWYLVGLDHSDAMDAPNLENDCSAMPLDADGCAAFGVGVDCSADINGGSDTPESDCVGPVICRYVSLDGSDPRKSSTDVSVFGPRLESSSTGDPSCTPCNV